MILITGVAGFIGYHLATKLLSEGEDVVGIDVVNDYYDPALKNSRLAILKGHENFHFYKTDICDYGSLSDIVSRYSFSAFCHLAAQAGVRYSLTHPFAYQKSNNEGFLSVLEVARHCKVNNFVYASSSSVYGSNAKMPFSESDRVDSPISLYAATKRSNELTAHCYSHLYGMNCSGLRFFTVYGPFGRPDMALFMFTKAILEDAPIEVYNDGKMKRNFTYIDDIVQGICITLKTPRRNEIYNIGNNRAELLMDFIKEIEINCGKKAHIHFLPLQAGDVVETVADISKLGAMGYGPKTNIDIGVKNFITWYRNYYSA